MKQPYIKPEIETVLYLAEDALGGSNPKDNKKISADEFSDFDFGALGEWT